jgi:hypothetical protein
MAQPSMDRMMRRENMLPTVDGWGRLREAVYVCPNSHEHRLPFVEAISGHGWL